MQGFHVFFLNYFFKLQNFLIKFSLDSFKQVLFSLVMIIISTRRDNMGNRLAWHMMDEWSKVSPLEKQF